jgi:hypothetical protein
MPGQNMLDKKMENKNTFSHMEKGQNFIFIWPNFFYVKKLNYRGFMFRDCSS